jgi:hypothetical protein
MRKMQYVPIIHATGVMNLAAMGKLEKAAENTALPRFNRQDTTATGLTCASLPVLFRSC